MNKTQMMATGTVLSSLSSCSNAQTAMVCGTAIIIMGLFCLYSWATDSTPCIQGRNICIKFQENR